MIAAGVALDDADLRQRGLDLLEWLLDYETVDGHLSPTPVGGRGPEDSRPGFDQQPIEVATLADACARAATVDARPLWTDGIRSAAAWFDGANDAGLPMWDPETGGGFDGLHADGVNLNQGAESTLACHLHVAARAALLAPCRNDVDPNRARHAQRATHRRRPVTGDHAAVRSGPGGLRASGVPSGSGARTHPRPRATKTCGPPWTTSSRASTDATAISRARSAGTLDELADRLDPDREISDARMLLLGATFTSEYAIEGAALCNPSIVAHPDQTGTAAGSLRFVMSVRAIGEGHSLLDRVPHRHRRLDGPRHDR